MKVLDDDKIVSLYNENVGVYNIAKQSYIIFFISYGLLSFIVVLPG